MSKLHVFDMDGTLLHGSACLHISEFLGVIDKVNVIEEAWGRGEVGHVEFYELCLPLWAGLHEAAIAQIFDKAPWIRNVARVFEDIAERGEFSAVITLSPMFFVERLRGWGATSAHGANVFGGVAPNPDLVLTPASKVTITMELLQRYGLSPADCVCYGDSASDIHCFAHEERRCRQRIRQDIGPDAKPLFRRWIFGMLMVFGRAMIDKVGA